jgi:hypothetical protein
MLQLLTARGHGPRASTISPVAKSGATMSNDALRRVRRLEEGCVYFDNNARVAFNSP